MSFNESSFLLFKITLWKNRHIEYCHSTKKIALSPNRYFQVSSGQKNICQETKQFSAEICWPRVNSFSLIKTQITFPATNADFIGDRNMQISECRSQGSLDPVSEDNGIRGQAAPNEVFEFFVTRLIRSHIQIQPNQENCANCCAIVRFLLI